MMRSTSRLVLVSILSISFGGSVFSSVFAQTERQSSSEDIQAIIGKAEEIYRRGDQEFAKAQLDAARKSFDQAIDAVLQSGVDVRANSRLDAYYRDLVERIHKHEAQPGDDHPEISAPAVLDELSSIGDAELATITPDGVKIFGSYDIDFTVAPPVLQFMNFFISGRGRSTMEIGLQRSGRYRQLAEKVFKEEKAPLDLIWLAQAESVWKPNALSRAAAKGIWQFIPGTGQRYGLEQTAWIDDRSHPEKSTRAAARYLKWLHEHFAGDWLLAMAAYNSGEHRVDEAIARCGYADFWELHKRGLLPAETRNYVPIILSIIIISKNQKRYGIDVKSDAPLSYDLASVPSQTDLKVVADLLGMPYDVIQELNSELRRGVTPPDGYTLKVPKGTKKAFEVAYASLPEDQRVRKIAIPRDDVVGGYRPGYRTQVVSYHARRGDTLQGLSRRYGVSVQEIAKLNKMSSRGAIRTGQTIRVPVKAKANRRDRHRGGKTVFNRSARQKHGGRHPVRRRRR